MTRLDQVCPIEGKHILTLSAANRSDFRLAHRGCALMTMFGFVPLEPHLGFQIICCMARSRCWPHRCSISTVCMHLPPHCCPSSVQRASFPGAISIVKDTHLDHLRACFLRKNLAAHTCDKSRCWDGISRISHLSSSDPDILSSWGLCDPSSCLQSFNLV